ncbi:MAG: FtsW/RodA/SpoVE family cell cycle protein [Thermoanaerobaculia bacterium]
MERKKKPDLVILICTALLFLIGILTVSSTSFVLNYVSKISFDKKHIMLSVLSILIIALLIAVDVRKFFSKGYLIIFYIFSIVLLIGLFSQPAINNTHRFYKFPGFLFQPSEFVKILLVIIAALILAEKKYPKSLLSLGKVLLPPIILILLQTDLGMSVLIIFVICIMLFYKGIPREHFLIVLGLSVLIMFLSILKEPYQMKRVKDFLEGESEHQIAAKVALGGGGFFGKGLGKSHQKFFYLSMPHTDFAFSILGEEMGFFGSFVVLCLYGIIFFRGMLLSTQMEGDFYKLLVFGLTVMFTLNSLIHISVNAGILPAKGITLPLISYGGSSMLSNSLLLGIILSISMRKP